jgi:hypothetical protein
MADSDDKNKDTHHGLSGWAIFIIIIVILLIIAILVFFLYVRRRNRRAASSRYPSPAPGGIVGWVNDRIAAMKRGRFTSGAGYEPSGSTLQGGSARAGHALDSDEAWDVRVGNEGIYEEQELGLRETGGYESTRYHGASGGGRERDRDLDGRYGDEMEGGRQKSKNPFGDDAAASLRSVSPRPLDISAATNTRQSGGSGSADSSPTGERRSVFRENV